MSNRSSKPLIKACIRHTQSQLSLDLSPCTRWLRFVEVHYQRPSPSADAPEISEVLLWFMCSVVGWLQMQQQGAMPAGRRWWLYTLVCHATRKDSQHGPARVPGSPAPGNLSVLVACVERSSSSITAQGAELLELLLGSLSSRTSLQS